MRQVNLLPKDLQVTERNRALRNCFVATIVPVVFILVLVHVLLSMSVENLVKNIESPPTKIDTPEINGRRTELTILKNALGQFVGQHQVVVEFLTHYLSMTDILMVIGESTKDKVWLTGLSTNMRKKSCQIEGKSFNTRLVSEFMLELKQLPYFSEVELITMGKEAAQGASEVDFKIVCTLK